MKHAIMCALALSFVLAVAPMPARPGTLEPINAANPGQETSVSQYVQAGKTTIVDFYSQYCPPCRAISPKLEQLAGKRGDVKVVKLDINRPDVKGIDWGSPLARQYKLQSIPHFKVYDESGNLKVEGDEAYQFVTQLLAKEGIR
jgi:thiol-disulfide isomerase/thioredoxin